MYWEIEITLFIFLIIVALIAISATDFLTAAVTLTVFSFMLALVFVAMGAIDVGFTEAVVGAGVTGVFLIVAIYNTTRRSED